MNSSMWGIDADVLQRGDFTDGEQEALRRYCDSHLGIVSRLRDLDGGSSRWGFASAALRCVANHFDAPHKTTSLDPRVRLAAFFVRAGLGQPLCNATAVRWDDPPSAAAPTYLISFNIEGFILIEDLLKKVCVSAPPPLKQLIEEVDLASDNFVALATIFVFLHEMGHVFRGHLEWFPPLGGACDELSERLRDERRVVEMDADLFATSSLRVIALGFAESHRRLGSSESDNAWLLGAFLACFAFFSIVVEEGFRAGPCYHRPLTRLWAVSQFMDERVRTMFFGVFAMMPKEVLALLPDQTVIQPDATDDELLRLITMPLYMRFMREGRFRGWIV